MWHSGTYGAHMEPITALTGLLTLRCQPVSSPAKFTMDLDRSLLWCVKVRKHGEQLGVQVKGSELRLHFSYVFIKRIWLKLIWSKRMIIIIYVWVCTWLESATENRYFFSTGSMWWILTGSISSRINGIINGTRIMRTQCMLCCLQQALFSCPLSQPASSELSSTRRGC